MELIESSGLNFSPPGESVAEGLQKRGWWVRPNVLQDTLVQALWSELVSLEERSALQRAGVGRGADFQLTATVRRDRTRWLTRGSLAQCLFLEQMEALRLEINCLLFLGLFEFECHFAWYDSGAFYKKHVDSFRGAQNRVVSVVAYLNDNWHVHDGGELVLYAPDSDIVINSVVPQAGTVAVFLSEEIPHEVLPTKRPRGSIAGWFRVNNSLGGNVDPPR